MVFSSAGGTSTSQRFDVRVNGEMVALDLAPGLYLETLWPADVAAAVLSASVTPSLSGSLDITLHARGGSVSPHVHAILLEDSTLYPML